MPRKTSPPKRSCSRGSRRVSTEKKVAMIAEYRMRFPKWLRTSVLPSFGDIPYVHQEQQVHQPRGPQVSRPVGGDGRALSRPEGLDQMPVGGLELVGEHVG